MTDALGPILAELRAMWGRRWAGALVAWAVALLAGAIIVRIPDRWEASARVYVDTQTIMKPLMNGLAVQPDVDQMVSMLARTLITRPNLEKLASNIDLARPGQSQQSLDQVVDKLQATIRIAPAGDKNLYIVSYRDTQPRLAELVVQNLVGLFVSSTLGSKRQDSEQARSFIDEQISAYEKKLEEAEGKVKDFKLHHFGFSGVNAQDHYQRLGSLTDDQKKLQLELHATEQSRDALKRELEGEDPILLPDASAGPKASATADLDARLDVLNKQLDDLMRRYTDDHPDVVSTKRLIADLEAQRKKEAESQHGKAGHGGTMMSPSSNPVYQQLKVAMAQAEANVASLRARLNDVTTQLEELRAEANRVPEYEAEMARLTRDYDVIRRNYDQLVQRRETASISEDIDLNASLAVFRVIDPPRVLPTPIFPSRQVLVPLALLGALVAGVLTSLGLAQAFPTVLSAHDLRALAERPLLATISLMSDAAGRTRRRLANAAFAGTLVALVLGYASWSTWLFLRAGSV